MERKQGEDAEPGGYARAVGLAERACALPAVATLDWCDRAAGCLAGLAPGLVGAVWIAPVGVGGEVGGVEAVGVASSKDGFTPGNPRGSPALRESWRARLAELRSIGIAVSSQAGGMHALAIGSRQPGGWAGTAIARALGEGSGADGVVCVRTIPGSAATRCLLTLLTTPAGQGDIESLARLCEAGTDLLARRAALAIGTRPVERGGWISAKEQEVLDLLLLGRSVLEISELLARSQHTVHDHVKSLHKKLRAANRAELVARTLGHLEARGPGEGEAR